MIELKTWYRIPVVVVALISLYGITSSVGQSQQEQKPAEEKTFVGMLKQTDDQNRLHPVRNDVAQIGDEIVTLRYRRIKKR